MSSEDIAGCSVCQITFSSHEEVLVHNCIQVKEENFSDLDYVEIKDVQNILENGSNFSPKNKRRKKKIVERSVVNVKSEPKIEFIEETFGSEEIYTTNNTSNLELLEEFIIAILKQVDELCQNVSSGDPDIKRTKYVNEKLNDVASCYRNALEHYNYENEHMEDARFLLVHTLLAFPG